MYKNILLITLCTWLWHGMSCTVNATDIQSKNTTATPLFWQSRTPNGDALRLTAPEIQRFNEQIIQKSPSVHSLAQYPATHNIQSLSQKFTTAIKLLDDQIYSQGTLLTAAIKTAIINECNISNIQQNTTYGVTLRRTNMRALPYSQGIFESPDDNKFDILQETAVDPGEPLIIRHTSKSGAFYYVQMRNYIGWIAAKDIVKTSTVTWNEFLSPTKFLVVTANRFSLPLGTETLLFQMGAKIPVATEDDHTYTVALPSAESELTYTKIAKTAPVHLGFLPYTTNVLIEQSFKFLNDPYGWGGLVNSVDCSSFIADIYRTVGIELPRNADEQELTAGRHTNMSNMTVAERQHHFSTLAPGDVLFFPGHTMMFLGMYDNRPFVIHSLGSHAKHYADGSKEKIRTMKVVVSDLSLRRYSGLTFAESMTGSMSFK